MSIATVRLQMEHGSEVYFRASRQEINQMVLMRHQQTARKARKNLHILTTANNIPITINLSQVKEIHIS